MAAPTYNYNSLNIFIVDDDEDDRSFLADTLLEIAPDVVVKEMKDGRYLIDRLLESAEVIPDIIFLDINMPGKSGLECLKEIKMQDGDLKNIKVIILSTSSDPLDIELAYELGASFYAVKPDSAQVMRLFIDEVLKTDWNENTREKFRLI